MPRFHRAIAFACLVAVGSASNASAQALKAKKLDTKKPVNVVNKIEGETPVLIVLKPHGARVEKGELVCELDPSKLNERLERQKAAIAAAEGAYKNAKSARETAEVAVTEYTDGIYPQQLQTIDSRLAISQANRKRAQNRFDFSAKMKDKAIMSKGQNDADKLLLDKLIIGEKRIQTEKELLEKFTKEKTVKKLQIQVERERLTELSRLRDLEREKAVERSIGTQIKACKVAAPTGGIVVFPRTVESDDVFRQGELLFQVVPDGNEPPAAPK